MKRLVIHSGLPKTGSSALQVFLAQNAAALRAQSFDYFSLTDVKEAAAGHTTSGNGLLFARSLLPDSDPELLRVPKIHLKAVHTAIASSACQTGILSSEYLARADPDKLTNFVATLTTAGIRVESLFFIRSQAHALSSMYVQDVKRNHGRDSLEAYVTGTYKCVPHLKYATHYKTHQQIFGPKNITIIRYEEATLIKSFLAAIGAAEQGLNLQIGPINPGLAPAEIAIMRELNKYRPAQRISDDLMTNSTRAGHKQATQNLMPASLITDIESYFADENAELSSLLFNGALLFPPTPLTNNVSSIGEVSTHDVINVLGGLLVRYDERLAQLEAQQNRSLMARVIRKIAATQSALRTRA